MNPDRLLEKLMNNEISREEFEKLLDGLDDYAIRAKYHRFLQEKFMEELEAHFGDADKDENPKTKDKGSTNPIRKKRKGDRQYPIAAIILAFVAVTFSILFILYEIENDQYLGESNQEGKYELITKATPNKRMFRTRLQDGSFIHLNAVSSVTYPREFSTLEREVEISGEAYFNIERDEQRPFKIKVKDHMVQVLGTSFNIEAHEDEDEMSVTVESGKVSVDLNDDQLNPVILTMDQKMIYSYKTGEYTIERVDARDELSWRQGVLRFDSTPMAKVEKMLERWYGYEIVIEDDEIYELKYNGKHKNQSIKTVLESLIYATRTKYSIEDNSIIIEN